MQAIPTQIPQTPQAKVFQTDLRPILFYSIQDISLVICDLQFKKNKEEFRKHQSSSCKQGITLFYNLKKKSFELCVCCAGPKCEIFPYYAL